jgi:hypothetical protein
MKSYTELKKNLIEHKSELRAGFYSCLIFLLGFGTGRGVRQLDAAPSATATQSNYPTKTQKNPEGADAGAKKTPAVVSKKPLEEKNCPIKGNISSKAKIYHIKGGAFYDRTNPEQCFNTEAEAQAAGFKKSSR